MTRKKRAKKKRREEILESSWKDIFLAPAHETVAPVPGQFRDPKELLSLAETRRLHSPGNRVTDFSGWVFDLCHVGRIRDPAALEMGKDVEQQLLAKRRARVISHEKDVSRARNTLGLPVPKDQGEEWERIFQDPLDATERKIFVISSLLVNDKPMVGVPDVVYRNRETGEILIVEIKASNRDVPTDGWPNLRVQLWCYAQIDDWVDAPKIILVSQVWRPSNDAHRQPTLKKNMIWKGTEPLEAECRALYNRYVNNA